MSTKGQTINDRLNAAKYTLAGQALARCICKATTEELMRPKKKHLDYLAACTYEQNVSMQQLTNLLIERTTHSNWAVVYKALITVHHLMSYGSERFTQYLASSNYTFQLNNFLDRIISKGYAMSTFIRRYSNYINQKALSYRTLAIDLCRTQRRSEDGVLRTMPIERLLETLPVIQKQLDALLDFNCTADELSNSIITASFTLLFHDAIRLFASYNDGIINLFEKYFDLNKKMCREAFEAYKKFLSATDRVAEFLKVAEAINLNRGELPDFKRAPSSLLDAFEQHLLSLENNKKREGAITRPDIDTKLAAFPSFSANSDFDSAQPTLGDISKEFEAHLAFSSADDDFEASLSKVPVTDSSGASLQTKPVNSSAISNNPLAADFQEQFLDITPSVAPPLTTTLGNNNNLSSINNVISLGTNNVISNNNNNNNTNATSPFAASLGDQNIFDMNPPGFSDGSLLTPEALQISIDPSIDPHTQQQLYQIKREQVAANRQNNNNNSNTAGGSLSNYGKTGTSNSNNKPNIFEDLEKTMRQSLQKSEKA